MYLVVRLGVVHCRQLRRLLARRLESLDDIRAACRLVVFDGKAAVGRIAYVVVPKPLLWTPPALAGLGAVLLFAGAGLDNAATGLPGLALLLAAMLAGIFVLVRCRQAALRPESHYVRDRSPSGPPQTNCSAAQFGIKSTFTKMLRKRQAYG
jgi:hypothetical protein